MHSWSRIPWRLTRALYARYAFTSDRYLSRQESLLHPGHLAYWTLVIPFQERSQRLESRSTTAGKSIHSGASLYRQSLATTGFTRLGGFWSWHPIDPAVSLFPLSGEASGSSELRLVGNRQVPHATESIASGSGCPLSTGQKVIVAMWRR